MRKTMIFLAFALSCSVVFAQKEDNGVRTHCDPAFTGADLGSTMAQPTGVGQVVIGDCTAISGCDDYFDIDMLAGDTVLASFCQGGGIAGFDTGLSVWSGAGFGVSEGCNDDSCGLQSEISFTAASAGTYRVRVGGFGGDSGTYDLFVVADPTSSIVGATGRSEVPTLGQWGLVAFLTALAVSGVWMMRRGRLA